MKKYTTPTVFYAEIELQDILTLSDGGAGGSATSFSWDEFMDDNRW